LDGHGIVVACACARRYAQAALSGCCRIIDWAKFPKGGATPDDAELKADLTGKEYGYNKESAIQLEEK
jgi:hypothetical protein